MSRATPRLKRTLGAQREHWEQALAERADRFGAEASEPARATAERLRREELTRCSSWAPARGRDSLFLAEQGFDVHAVDYASSATEAIEQKAGS